MNQINFLEELGGKENMNLENSINNPNAQQLPSGGASQAPKPLVQFSGGTYSTMINPNLQPMPLPPHLLEKVYFDELEVAKANAKKSHEYLLKSNLEFQKNCYAERREETRERHRRERDLVQLRVFENPDGFLCVEHKYPDGTTKHSQAILSISKLRLKKAICPMIPEKNCYKVFWHENPQGVKIPDTEMTANKLAMVLQKHGIVLCVSKAKKAETLEAIYSFLFENLEAEEDLLIFGWNKTKSGWIFNSMI